MSAEVEVKSDAPQERGRLRRGAAIEFGTFGLQQILRLGSNLLLTRWLFPEAMGLSILVGTVVLGLSMLSDMGTRECVIRSPRGEEPLFLNTAFTLLAVRGLVLGVLLVVLAQPAAWFFKEPQLRNLIYLSALQTVISCLHSTSTFTLRRRLVLGRLNAFELAIFFITLGVTLPWAYVSRSVWPLVGGNFVGTCLYTVGTHMFSVGYRNRFQWDPAAAREISQFGRWIFGSSAASFAGSQIDRILFGRFSGAAWLGIYSIAVNLSEALASVVSRMIGSLLYPALGRMSTAAPEEIGRAYYHFRLRLDLLSMLGSGFLGGFGGWIIYALWDSRYSGAAWMLQILCVRVALGALASPAETCLTAQGLPRFGFLRSLSRGITSAVAIPVGYHFYGVPGVIWAGVVSELPSFFVVWPALYRRNQLRISRELLAVALFVVAFGAGTLLKLVIPEVHVRR